MPSVTGWAFGNQEQFEGEIQYIHTYILPSFPSNLLLVTGWHPVSKSICMYIHLKRSYLNTSMSWSFLSFYVWTKYVHMYIKHYVKHYIKHYVQHCKTVNHHLIHHVKHDLNLKTLAGNWLKFVYICTYIHIYATEWTVCTVFHLQTALAYRMSIR